MFRFMILVAILAASVSAEIASPCVTGGDLPISFEIEGCSTTPCALPQLEDAVFNAKFRAPESSQSLRANLSAFLVGIISIPYDLGADAEACTGLSNASCPVKEGKVLDYSLKLHIEPFFFVGTAMNIEINVQTESGARAFCARVPIAITAPKH